MSVKKKIKYTKATIKAKEKKDRLIFNESFLKGRRNPIRAWDIKLGDEVIIISGDDKGKTGKVLKVLASKAQLIIEDINIIKKHQKPKQGQEHGEIIERPAPINISNVSHLVMKDGKAIPTRIRHKEGKRIAVKTGEEI